MPLIIVTDSACEMLRRMANREVGGVVRRLEDGSLEIEISGRLHDELEAARFPGETLSACVLRYLPIRSGGRR